MILNDGETFTDLTGCTIAEVPDYFHHSQQGIKGWGYPVVAEFAQVESEILVMQRYPNYDRIQISRESLRKGT